MLDLLVTASHSNGIEGPNAKCHHSESTQECWPDCLTLWNVGAKWDCLRVGDTSRWSCSWGKLQLNINILWYTIFRYVQKKTKWFNTEHDQFAGVSTLYCSVIVCGSKLFEPQTISLKYKTRKTCPVHGVISSPRSHTWSSEVQNSPLTSWELSQSKVIGLHRRHWRQPWTTLVYRRHL